jgi:hypothetical protein
MSAQVCQIGIDKNRGAGAQGGAAEAQKRWLDHPTLINTLFIRFCTSMFGL